jgi:hypothetical protein
MQTICFSISFSLQRILCLVFDGKTGEGETQGTVTNRVTLNFLIFLFVFFKK